jgi:hypothetical protein
MPFLSCCSTKYWLMRFDSVNSMPGFYIRFVLYMNLCNSLVVGSLIHGTRPAGFFTKKSSCSTPPSFGPKSRYVALYGMPNSSKMITFFHGFGPSPEPRLLSVAWGRSFALCTHDGNRNQFPAQAFSFLSVVLVFWFGCMIVLDEGLKIRS